LKPEKHVLLQPSIEHIIDAMEMHPIPDAIVKACPHGLTITLIVPIHEYAATYVIYVLFKVYIYIT